MNTIWNALPTAHRMPSMAVPTATPQGEPLRFSARATVWPARKAINTGICRCSSFSIADQPSQPSRRAGQTRSPLST